MGEDREKEKLVTSTERDELLSRLFLSPADAARLLGVDARTVRRAVGNGDIPATRIGTKILVRASWIREQAGIEEGGNGVSRRKCRGCTS